ncbi:MAG TPA: hypothetical protein VNN06_05915 [Ramlibacter sp.]|nr:hypothetical protein [Ramlibacter sp.]
MLDFDKALSGWEAAQSAWARSELAFSRAVYLYLVMLGPAPSSTVVDAVTNSRLSAEAAFAQLCAALRQARQTVPLL